MGKRLALFTLAICLFATQELYSQVTTTLLLEKPLFSSEVQTIRFLTAVAGGKKPQSVADGNYRNYSLEGPAFHVEYKIANDTCVMAGIRFTQESSYQQFTKDLFRHTRPFGVNRISEMAGRKIIYSLSPAEKVVTAACFDFALRKAMEH